MENVKERLIAAARLIRSEDKEARSLGEKIFFSEYPSDEDIDTLNNLTNGYPIMNTYEEMKNKEVFENCLNIRDIFNDKEGSN